MDDCAKLFWTVLMQNIFIFFKQKNEKIRAENCFICYTWFVASSRKDPQDGDAL